jgi:hypothetical protein
MKRCTNELPWYQDCSEDRPSILLHVPSYIRQRNLLTLLVMSNSTIAPCPRSGYRSVKVTGTRVVAPSNKQSDASASNFSDSAQIYQEYFTCTLCFCCIIFWTSKLSYNSPKIKQDNGCSMTSLTHNDVYLLEHLIPASRTVSNNQKWALGDIICVRGAHSGFDIINTAVGLFQSDHDLDIGGCLSHEAGLTIMEEEAQALANAAGKDK